jgi:hypothetical protein
MPEKTVEELQALARAAVGTPAAKVAATARKARIVKGAETDPREIARQNLARTGKVMFWSRPRGLTVKVENGKKLLDELNRVISFPGKFVEFVDQFHTCTDPKELEALLAAESFGRLFYLAEEARVLLKQQEAREKRESVANRQLLKLEAQGLVRDHPIPQQMEADQIEDGGN